MKFDKKKLQDGREDATFSQEEEEDEAISRQRKFNPQLIVHNSQSTGTSCILLGFTKCGFRNLHNIWCWLAVAQKTV
jgi:hypothetical protein